MNKEKTVTGIIQEIADDICNNYCKYSETMDDDCCCEAERKGIECPLERLY